MRASKSGVPGASRFRLLERLLAADYGAYGWLPWSISLLHQWLHAAALARDASCQTHISKAILYLCSMLNILYERCMLRTQYLNIFLFASASAVFSVAVSHFQVPGASTVKT
jgi:hypothetical protein